MQLLNRTLLIKSRKDGSQYYTYRLVESKRTEAGARQYTLLYLGVDFSVPRNQWPTLTKRIEEILGGQQSLFEVEHDIENLAQEYASRVITTHQDIAKKEELDYREVDPNSLKLTRPRSVGNEHVTLETVRFLGLDSKLRDMGFNGPQTAAALGSIIGRACNPGSELATHGWLQEQSGLGELIDYDYKKLSLYGMYEVSDQLLKKKVELESFLYEKERNLFQLQETITLYDLTNTYFEGQCKANNLAARGHSKERLPFGYIVCRRGTSLSK